MIIRPTTKELFAASLKELSVQKSVDKITVREIAQNCGFTAKSLANPMAWLGACILLTIAFLITRKKLMRLYKEDD